MKPNGSEEGLSQTISLQDVASLWDDSSRQRGQGGSLLLHCVTASSILPSASMSSSVSYLYSLCQVVHTLLDASADVPHSLDKAYLSVEAGSWKVGWTLQQTGQVVQGDLFRCNPSPLLGYYWRKVPPWSPERPTAIWTPPTATSGKDG